MNNKTISFLSLTLMGTLVLAFSGCGKHETAGGTVGAATGVAIGSAVAGRNDKGTGALIGGLIGNYIGRSAGRAEDKEERAEEHREQLDRAHAETRRLEREMAKWCPSCNVQVKLSGAQSCPDCGSHLIHEKYCNRCRTIFAPETRYRYCPYCSVKTSLESR